MQQQRLRHLRTVSVPLPRRSSSSSRSSIPRSLLPPPARNPAMPAPAAAAAAAAAAPGSSPTAAPAAREVWRVSPQGSLANLRREVEPLLPPAAGDAAANAAAPAPVALAPGQVLIEVRAVGLNFADVFCCLGLYKAAPPGPFVPGLEVAGVVAAVGPPLPAAAAAAGAQSSTPPAPPQLANGDRVIGVTRFGGFATHLALPATYVRPLPDGWTFGEGAAFAVQALTAAYGLLRLGDLKEACERRRAEAEQQQQQQGGGSSGDVSSGGRDNANASGSSRSGGRALVLVQSAAGGVGLQALAICAAHGARVLALVGSEAKAQQLRALLRDREAKHGPLAGGAHVDVAVRVTGEAAARAQLASYLEAQRADGFDVFLDSTGGDYLRPGLAALAPCGRHVIFGAGALTPPPGASLAFGVGLLRPRNLLAALRLACGWVTRPRVDVLSLPGTNTGSLGFNLIYLYGRADLTAALYADVDALRLPPPHVGLVETWARLPEALAALQGGGTLGKVVVEVGGGSGGGDD